MSKHFLVEAMMCMLYFINGCPTKILDIKTPHTVWNTHKTSVSHFKVFNSIAYSKILYLRRTMLEDKREKCILVEYDDRTIGYQLYNPITKKVIFS